MTPNATGQRMSRRREKAALLVAEDVLTDQQIADQIGVNKITLERWKRQPVFAARVQEHRDQWAAELEAEGIANRKNRVAMLDRDWQRLEQVVRERAQDPAMAKVPGGTAGVMVHTIKVVGVGGNAQRVDEYSVDTGLLKEKREHAKQAAQELGQWTERQELTGKDGGPIEVDDAREQLASRVASIVARLRARDGAVEPDSGSGEAATP